MDLDAAFPLACLGMSPRTLEQQVGEQRYGGRVYDMELVKPLGVLPLSAVR